MRTNGTRVLEQLIGALLVLVGLAFFVLLAVLKHGGQLTGDLRVSGLMSGSGAVLIWTGYRFLTANSEQPKTARQKNFDLFPLKLRSPGELIAAAGCVLMVCRIVSVLSGAPWPSGSLFEAALVAPVVIGLFALKLWVPAAFQSSLFPDVVAQKWSPIIRQLLSILIRVGWLGYPAIFLAWPDVASHIPVSARIFTDVIAYSAICLLYASQIVVLHFGNMRQQHE